MRTPPHLPRNRGSALLTTMAMVTVLLIMVSGILAYALRVRVRAINEGRVPLRASCAETGLQLARAYFLTNVNNWPAYLANPATYDPVPATWMSALAAPNNVPADPTSPVLQHAHPELFADLDGDGLADVYIYVRDNQDELPPAVNDWTRDNDQNVIVGAVCISGTLAPRLQDGTPDRSQLSVEGLLSYNVRSSTFRSQNANGAAGDGNLNN